MKIKIKEVVVLTKEQEQAPVHKTIFTTKSNESFEKQSLWRKYRIIKQNDTTFKVEEIDGDISFGLPIVLGGNGLTHIVWYWKEEKEWIDYKPYTSHEEALESINERIDWLITDESEVRDKKVLGREVVGVYP